MSLVRIDYTLIYLMIFSESSGSIIEFDRSLIWDMRIDYIWGILIFLSLHIHLDISRYVTSILDYSLISDEFY